MTGELRIEDIVVYAAMDAVGETLYVGQTRHLARRIREHRRLSLWWPAAVKVDPIKRVANLAEALDWERFLIKACHPRFNAVHGSRDGARQWRELAAAGVFDMEARA